MLREILIVFGCLFAVGAVSGVFILVCGIAGILLTDRGREEQD